MGKIGHWIFGHPFLAEVQSQASFSILAESQTPSAAKISGTKLAAVLLTPGKCTGARATLDSTRKTDAATSGSRI